MIGRRALIFLCVLLVASSCGSTDPESLNDTERPDAGAARQPVDGCPISSGLVSDLTGVSMDGELCSFTERGESFGLGLAIYGFTPPDLEQVRQSNIDLPDAEVTDRSDWGDGAHCVYLPLRNPDRAEAYGCVFEVNRIEYQVTFTDGYEFSGRDSILDPNLGDRWIEAIKQEIDAG